MYEHGTQHYNLPQTVGTDKRDWFDTNEAFASVDADLHSAKQTAENVASDLSTTNDSVTALGNRVSTAEGDIVDIKAGLQTANDNIGTNATAIAGLTTEVTDNKQDLEDMITAYEEATATASMSHNVGDYFRYNDVLWITTITIRVGDTIVPDVNCRSTNVMARVKALEGGGGGATPLASSVMYDNADSGLTATDVQEAIDEIDGITDVLTSGVQANSTAVSNISTNLTANNTTAGVSNVPFKFGCTDDGKYGYILQIGGADTVIPFKDGANKIKSNYTITNGSLTATIDITDVSGYENLSMNDLLVVPKSIYFTANSAQPHSTNRTFTPSYSYSNGIISITDNGYSYNVAGAIGVTVSVASYDVYIV